MLYDLDNEMDRIRFRRRAEELEGGRKVVELTDRSKRTSAQNAYLHLILGYFAMETGYTLDFVKREYFKRLVNGEMFRKEVEGRWGKVEDLRSSRDLSTEEMSAAIDRFRNWSSQEAGIYLPAPNEEDFLRDIEKELNRVKRYL